MFLSILLCLALQVFQKVSADEDFFINDVGYDDGTYGDYPQHIYKSTDVTSPKLNVLQSSPECSNDLYTMITQRGWSVSQARATILDSDGHLVWTVTGYDQIYNLMVQEYKGEQYLTFWAGNDAVGGHGAGYYYMLDTSYQEIARIPAAKGLSGDLHDFRITDNGTAIITVYDVITANLTSLGKPENGDLWECRVQEIVLETGELIFEWRASEHYDVTETYRDIGGDGVTGRAFDFFHMNSIDKDDKGNYLVSSRYMHTVTYISGATGEVIWVLGGKRNMFTDLSDGQATNFAYQHDARWNDDFTVVSLFNNAIDDGHTNIAPYTRGMRIKLDQEKMTAELVGEYINPHHIKAVSQGSFQNLPNGNVFMGYGNTAAFTEYSSNGMALCDAHFGPQHLYGTGNVQSYRAYKFEWHGFPITNPDIKILSDDSDNWNVYTSWNGATEIRTLILQGASNSEDSTSWEDLEVVTKTTFETAFQIYELYPRYMRVLWLDEKDMVLGVSNPLDAVEEKVWALPPLRLDEGELWGLKILIGFAAFTGAVVAVREAWLVWRKRGKQVHWEDEGEELRVQREILLR
ncbi:ASST-domain-containing protein [Halenospora varia]|nr:ASST-domain-containing protein [Halenospora varia]